MAANSQKINILLTSMLEFIEYSNSLDNSLNSEKKFELFQKAKQLTSVVKEAKKEAPLLSEEQIDQLGFAFTEKLFNTLKVQ